MSVEVVENPWIWKNYMVGGSGRHWLHPLALCGTVNFLHVKWALLQVQSIVHPMWKIYQRCCTKGLWFLNGLVYWWAPLYLKVKHPLQRLHPGSAQYLVKPTIEAAESKCESFNWVNPKEFKRGNWVSLIDPCVNAMGRRHSAHHIYGGKLLYLRNWCDQSVRSAHIIATQWFTAR